MKMTKSHWSSDGNNVQLAMPFSKVDTEQRRVSGFATLDNIDKSNDVILASASLAAFETFRGNIREMHQPIAAGRLVTFKNEFYYDSEDEAFYSGIYVDVYVSKGAESTWEKVLDGTLTGFSIGGNIKEAESEYVPDAGKVIRFIKAYELIELSLVDRPCNQHANVFAIQKNSEGSFAKGITVDTKVTNVFWCPTHEVAKNSDNESESCGACGERMQVIGWFEEADNTTQKVQELVRDFLKKGVDTTDGSVANGEGGVNMTDETNTEPTSETPEEVAPEEVETEEVAPEEVAETPSEVASEPDFEKMFNDLQQAVTENLEENKGSVAKAVETIEKMEERVQAVTESFDKKAEDFQKSLDELRGQIETNKADREEVAKRLQTLEGSNAIRKSGEVETTPEKSSSNGMWSGAFFGGS